MDVTAPPVASPLAGTVVRAFGDSTALRVAADRLRSLGCAVEAGGAPVPGADAGLLRLADGPECAISWAGASGLPLASEADVQAACGLMRVHGRATGGPRALGVAFASVCAGVLAAQAVLAGALAALRGGTAVRAATSVAGAAALAVTQYAAVASAGERVAAGGRTPPFRSADGVRFEIETLDAEDWLRFWTALGADRAAVAAGWPPFQRRFATATCALPPALADATAAVGYAAVRAAADAAGVSVVAVRAADAPLPPPPASPWRLRELDDGGPARPALPALSPGARKPLAGLRVVESATRVQGPLAGHVLGLLGADVVRLEPPGGDPLRGVPPLVGGGSARFRALNRGKSAVEADLKSPAGRAAALRLAASAHVFLENWPPGRAARLGLTEADLAAAAPALVRAHAGGWAETPPAPRPLGTDYLVQAHTGVAALLGGAPTLLTVTDVLGALICAEGVLAGLLARARSGTGVVVETALTDAARLLRAAPYAAPSAAPDVPAAAEPGACAALFERDADGVAHARAPWTFTDPREPA
ncbi:CoA transferase [Actinomadura atramentaria]|uniref:CoA transferase n=1 Tax=Actinomadura atramentaria TaxID=1990 RepID=UPI000372632D|nr:CoA transferase [Actinomadura atramentaria]